jgi:hypothetical protein
MDSLAKNNSAVPDTNSVVSDRDSENTAPDTMKIPEWAAELLTELELAYSDQEFTPVTHPEREILRERLDKARIKILRGLIALEILGPEIDKAQQLIAGAFDGKNINLFAAAYTISEMERIRNYAMKGGAA